MTDQFSSRTPLWSPSEDRKRDANINRFIQAINAQHRLNLTHITALSVVR
jgi:hypothetical protein